MDLILDQLLSTSTVFQEDNELKGGHIMKRSSLVVWQLFGWRLFHLVQYVKLVKEPVPKLTPDVALLMRAS